MITIILNNNKSKIEGPIKLLLQLIDHPLFAVRVKGAFFSEAFRKRRWDGYIRFITERGYIQTGKVPELIDVLEEMGEDIKIIDDRENKVKPVTVPKKLGKYKLRDYQLGGLKSIATNRILGKRFPRGIIFGATNFGKTITSAGIHIMYGTKTLFFINSKELFNQAIEEMAEFIPKEDIGYVSAEKGIVWRDFMIVMIPTAYSRIKEIGNKFASYPVVIVDECDVATSKSYKTVLNYTFNSYVRVGLSGSAIVDKRKKEKNEQVKATFGKIIYEVRNRELMDKGYSSEVKVFIWQGNTEVKIPGNWDEEYEMGIVKSKERNMRVFKRAKTHVKKKRLPLLVMVKLRPHVQILYKGFKKYAKIHGHEFFGLTIDWVDHERPERKQIVKDFKEGKIDILIGSYILKRGKNFPLMRAIIHAGAGDSMENVLQVLGRATRKHKSLKEKVLDDFYDRGKYLKRHSGHRETTYKNEKLNVILKYDPKLTR